MLTMLPPPVPWTIAPWIIDWRIAGRRLAAVPDALDVDRHRGIPLGLLDRIEAAAMQGAVERGVVDQRVEPAERPHRGLDHVAGRAGIGHVEWRGDALAPFSSPQINGGRPILHFPRHPPP